MGEFGRWYRAGANPDDPGGKLAFQRLRQSLFTPQITPKFTMRREDKVYAIGSCFARGVENALSAHQIDVPSRTTEFDALPAVNGELQLGYTNKYNTYSILNELSWALDPGSTFPRESLVELEPGIFYDPHANQSLELAGYEETLRRRLLMQSITRQIASCRVVIITLGLVEVWRDQLANVFLNITPHRTLRRKYPERYEFQISQFAENLSNLEKIHQLLKTFGHPQTEIVVTVSPVPLMATFSEQDVVVANTYSKSLLRAVAQEWASVHDNVHYFPSYEIVQNSDRAITWETDLRHVHGEVVLHIMQLFLDHYLP